MESGLTRREVLNAGAKAGAAAGLLGLAADPVIERALAATVSPRANLRQIEHVVILMQENRSFDHYFGTFPGVRGFGDSHGRAAFTQTGFPAQPFGSTLRPFRMVSNGTPVCHPDITHDWGPTHRSWDGGMMDRFVAEHIATDGAGPGPATMGYFDQSDIAFYWGLAQAFTLCDRYHCSVLAPTDPNRLYAMTGMLDPAGANGGPLLETLVVGRAAKAGTFTWMTMPERLQARGVSWKVYNDPGGGVFDNVLTYFRSYQTDAALNSRGITPTYPADFMADIAHGSLPQVSWVLTSVAQNEHPAFSTPQVGQFAARQVLSALTANKKLWSKTALFITWDEPGGFFDHVAPPTAPPGTAGEYVTADPLPAAAQGINGPIGLGLRVPTLVVSPFSRGGFVCSDVFDHTSMLRFLETRFGVEVPNLTRWRRSVTGDLTSAFNFAARAQTKVPALPAVQLTADQVANGGCPPGASTTPYPVPSTTSVPTQRRGRPKRPSGLRSHRHRARRRRK